MIIIIEHLIELPNFWFYIIGISCSVFLYLLTSRSV